MASRTHPGVEALAPLLAESQAQAREREFEVVRGLTGPNAPSLILFGAGGLRAHRPDRFDRLLSAIPTERSVR